MHPFLLSQSDSLSLKDSYIRQMNAPTGFVQMNSDVYKLSMSMSLRLKIVSVQLLTRKADTR